MVEKISAFNEKANAVILGFINNYSDSIFIILLMVVVLLGFTFFILFLRGLWIEKIKEEVCKKNRILKIMEQDLKDADLENRLLLESNLELNSRADNLLSEKQFLESGVFKKYDKMFKAAGLISDDENIETKEIEYTRDSYAYKNRRGKL